jgi:hypothetical protein
MVRSCSGHTGATAARQATQDGSAPPLRLASSPTHRCLSGCGPTTGTIAAPAAAGCGPSVCAPGCRPPSTRAPGHRSKPSPASCRPADPGASTVWVGGGIWGVGGRGGGGQGSTTLAPPPPRPHPTGSSVRRTHAPFHGSHVAGLGRRGWAAVLKCGHAGALAAAVVGRTHPPKAACTVAAPAVGSRGWRQGRGPRCDLCDCGSALPPRKCTPVTHPVASRVESAGLGLNAAANTSPVCPRPMDTADVGTTAPTPPPSFAAAPTAGAAAASAAARVDKGGEGGRANVHEGRRGGGG